MREVREFRFHIKTPPSEEIIDELHMDIAKDFIAMYGKKTMSEVLRVMEEIEERKKAANKQ